VKPDVVITVLEEHEAHRFLPGLVHRCTAVCAALVALVFSGRSASRAGERALPGSNGHVWRMFLHDDRGILQSGGGI
jgi:hypothetical protein